MATSADEERLLAAQVAFERGDFAEVRALAARLRESLDPEVRKQAEALAQRVGIDPAAVALFALCLLFFVGVCVHYLGRG